MNDNSIIPIPNDDTWDICKPSINKLNKTEDMQEVKEEVKELADVKDLELLGLSINGKSYTVKDNLQLETFISLNALIKAEGAILKAIYEKEVEVDIKPADAFHVASLLLNFTKKKQYVLEVNKKMRIHISNKKANTENKIAKRRNKKKLDKKFKK
jgi:hypothetical protein